MGSYIDRLMRIQTEYMSFKIVELSSSYDFQAPQQRSQRRCRFSQIALQCFEVIPCRLLALQGATRLVVVGPRVVMGAPRCSQVHLKFSPDFRGVLILVTITPMVLLYQSSEIPVTPKACQNAPLGSDTLMKLTHLTLHSTSSQALLEASSD